MHAFSKARYLAAMRSPGRWRAPVGIGFGDGKNGVSYSRCNAGQLPP
jgi:hypothetical protein